MNYIEIEKDMIPYTFEIDLGEGEYGLEINYNERFDFFTVDLYVEERPIVIGEKLILNRPLFEGLVDINLPTVSVIPVDRSDSETRITYENLEKTVFLMVGESDEFI